MEEKVEEVKVGDKVFRSYKVDYARLEKRQGYKTSAFPKVEDIGAQLECAAKGISGTGAMATYTHFISIPLIIYKEVKNAYSELKKAIMSDADSHIDPDLFNPDNHIHLTITMLALETKEKVLAASKALMQAWDKIVAAHLTPIKLHLKGLGSFSKRADKTNLVYAKLVEDAEYEKLIQIGDIIIKQMVSAGALYRDELSHITYYPDHDSYKIDEVHMTLLNAKFKAKVAGGKEKKYLFDPTPVLKYYADYEFGTFTVERMELSKINEFNKETGYYLAEQVVPTSLQSK